MTKARTPSIFTTIAASTIPLVEEQIARVAGLPVGYEFRLDYLHDHSNLQTRIHEILVGLHSPQVIATCRRQLAGGKFAGTVEEQVAVLQQAVKAGCRWVDLEIESVDAAGAGILKKLAPAKLIVSYHNYQKTPPLGAVYRRIARLPVQVVKLAGFANKLEDNLQIAKLAQARARRSPRLVALGMGPSGLPSRILAVRWGSPFTYASVGNHQGTAPGQLPAENMRTTYRVDRLDRKTGLYGIVGSHAAMSLSPIMQNAAFQAKHFNAVFLPCQTPRIKDFIKFASRMKFQGFSVTMPYKRAIISHLDWLDPLAKRIGACNTVAVQKGKWMGWNTDAAAVVEVLAKRLRLPGSRILILGAGGAARAAAYALSEAGADLLITARRSATADHLAKLVSARSLPWEKIDNLDVDAVVNATPVGMPPHWEASPIDLSRLRARVVFDMVYYPLETRLLSDARGRGLVAISGLEMLVAQGARQFEIWTGLNAPGALMEHAVRQALGHTSTGT